MDVEEFLYEATYLITRATRLAWTGIFYENQNEGWSDEEED